MFGKLFLGELKKILRPKTLLILSILFVIFFVIFALIYNINIEATMLSVEETGNETLDEYIDLINQESQLFKDVTAENIDGYITVYGEMYDTSVEDGDGMDYYNKGILTLLEYVKANNLYGENLNIAGYTSFADTNAEDFAMSYFSIVLSILIVYSIVAMAGLYVDEYKNGTIKLIMLRPITRNQLTLAKILAMFTALLGLLGVTTLIGYLYGLAAYGSVSTTQFLVLFNARHVSVMTYGGYVFINMLFGAVSLLTYGLLSFTLGTLFRKKTPAILIGFVIMLGIISTLLSLIDLERFLLSTNIDLGSYFGLSYSVPAKANFFIAMPMLLLYSALMYFGTFFVTNKRDIV